MSRDFAGWWRAMWRGPAAPLVGAGMASLGLGGCGDVFDRGPMYPEPMLSQEADTVDQHVDALKLQQDHGWNVGHEDWGLRVPSPVNVDVRNGDGWRALMPRLATALAPSAEWLLPFYVPTLFTAPAAPHAEDLRAALTPMHSREMDEDFGRGRALANLVAAARASGAGDLAVVIDAPGARAVAVAAGLAPVGEPVFTFGNWPHPAGAVPAEETLAATLFYAPLFVEAAQLRTAPALPVWVLDGNRLTTSENPDAQFDNRYGVTLPDAATLARHGIRRILYVNADGGAEHDDLNRGFAELCAGGVEIQTVSLADFTRAAPELAAAAEVEDDEDDDAADGWFARFEVGFGGRYFFGGCPYWHAHFWERCGWYHVAAPRVGARMRTFAPMPHTFRSPGVRAVAPRATAFSGFHGPTAQVVHPGTLGRVWVQSARGSGQVMSVYHAPLPAGGRTGGGWVSHGGGAVRSSGSLGRVGGGWSGGGHSGGGFGGG